MGIEIPFVKSFRSSLREIDELSRGLGTTTSDGRTIVDPKALLEREDVKELFRFWKNRVASKKRESTRNGEDHSS